MQIRKIAEGDKLTIAVEGRIDAVTSREFEPQVTIDGVKELVFDFSGVEYISSAGLRIIVKTLKLMKDQGGTMALSGVRPIVREVFDITGFGDRLTFV